MKQTRQAVRAIKQSILLRYLCASITHGGQGKQGRVVITDVYGGDNVLADVFATKLRHEHEPIWDSTLVSTLPAFVGLGGK
jgi:hypothetical protein